MSDERRAGGRVERRGRVARLRIERPEKRNALNSALIEGLTASLRELASERQISVVVISGAGGTFSAGADVQEMRGLDAAQARAFIVRLHTLIEMVRRLPQIVIAAIEGHCYGGALELAAGCDLRIAAEGALFGMPEIRVGMPSVIEAALLVPLVGLGGATDLVLTGETIDAAEALRIGLVSRVAPAANFEQTVDALAERLAG